MLWREVVNPSLSIANVSPLQHQRPPLVLPAAGVARGKVHGVQRAPLGQNVCERGQSFRNPLSCDNLASAARELPPEGRLEQRLRPQIRGEQKRQGKHGSFSLTWGQRQRGVSQFITQSRAMEAPVSSYSEVLSDKQRYCTLWAHCKSFVPLCQRFLPLSYAAQD